MSRGQQSEDQSREGGHGAQVRPQDRHPSWSTAAAAARCKQINQVNKEKRHRAECVDVLYCVQVDPAGHIWLHPPPPQLDDSSHLLQQHLVLPPPDLVLLVSDKEEEEGFPQGEEGRQVLDRELRLEEQTRRLTTKTFLTCA